MDTKEKKKEIFKNINDALNETKYSKSQTLVQNLQAVSKKKYRNKKYNQKMPNYKTMQSNLVYTLLFLYYKKRKFVYTPKQRDNAYQTQGSSNFSVLHIFISLHLAKICNYHYKKDNLICKATLTPLGRKFVNNLLPTHHYMFHNLKKYNFKSKFYMFCLIALTIISLIIPGIFIRPIFTMFMAELVLSLLFTCTIVIGKLCLNVHKFNLQVKLIKSNSKKLTVNNFKKFLKAHHIPEPDCQYHISKFNYEKIDKAIFDNVSDEARS